MVLTVWSLQPATEAGKSGSGEKFDNQPPLTNLLSSLTELFFSIFQIKKAKKNGDRLGFLV